MHLAPTSSTTALLVLGDALAVVASRAINYTKEDFGLHHPAGALGKKLIVKVKDLMHSGENNATVLEKTTLHKDCGRRQQAKRNNYRWRFTPYARQKCRCL